MVTIIGGGIAGTVLAGALARDGVSVTVYERRAAVEEGAFLVLDGRAHDTLGELGVSVANLHAVSHAVDGLAVHEAGGRDRTIPGDGRRMYFRSDLMRVLTDFARATPADIRYDCPVTDFDAGTVRIRGESLPIVGPLIAADGIDSMVRARLEPARPAIYAHQVVVYGVTDGPLTPPSEKSLLHFQIHRIGDGQPTDAFGHLWNDDTAAWFARITRPPIPFQDIGFHPVHEWADAVRAVAPDIPDLVDAMLDDTGTVHVSNARNVPLAGARPPRDDVILCGDADHAITPAAGVGARDAIQDAFALHHAISTGASLPAAMTARRNHIATERANAAQFRPSPPSTR
ncbi:FAD-dependent oxidoreductase [Nocardia sp. NBC_00403]|uniref:FAD-dependent oxidoreductase n=1 Tax=Nocardia sp. NBC_00403 TaxID=2975990 RepID=UPI002E1EB56D